jgi:hypothetical protein
MSGSRRKSGERGLGQRSHGLHACGRLHLDRLCCFGDSGRCREASQCSWHRGAAAKRGQALSLPCIFSLGSYLCVGGWAELWRPLTECGSHARGSGSGRQYNRLLTRLNPICTRSKQPRFSPPFRYYKRNIWTK